MVEELPGQTFMCTWSWKNLIKLAWNWNTAIKHRQPQLWDEERDHAWRHLVDQKGVMLWGWWLPAHQNLDHAYIQTDWSCCRRGPFCASRAGRSQLVCSTTWMVIEYSWISSRLHNLVVCRLTSQVFISRGQESLLLSVSIRWTYMSSCSSRIYAA